MADALWDARARESVQFFTVHVLAPLIAATRPPELRSAAAVTDTARAWILCLKDVPADILTAGVESLMAAGPTWMPRPGDLRQACAGLIAERRKDAGLRGHALIADCLQCDGTGFERMTVAGVEYVKPCGCKARALSLLEGLPQALALPPGDDQAAAEVE